MEYASNSSKERVTRADCESVVPVKAIEIATQRMTRVKAGFAVVSQARSSRSGKAAQLIKCFAGTVSEPSSEPDSGMKLSGSPG